MLKHQLQLVLQEVLGVLEVLVALEHQMEVGVVGHHLVEVVGVGPQGQGEEEVVGRRPFQVEVVVVEDHPYLEEEEGEEVTLHPQEEVEVVGGLLQV